MYCSVSVPTSSAAVVTPGSHDPYWYAGVHDNQGLGGLWERSLHRDHVHAVRCGATSPREINLLVSAGTGALNDPARTFRRSRPPLSRGHRYLSEPIAWIAFTGVPRLRRAPSHGRVMDAREPTLKPTPREFIGVRRDTHGMRTGPTVALEYAPHPGPQPRSERIRRHAAWYRRATARPSEGNDPALC